MPDASVSSPEEEPQAAAVTNAGRVYTGAQSSAVSRISGREKLAKEDLL